MLKYRNIIILTGMVVFFFCGCATYYQKQIEFQQDFVSGDLEGARKFLLKNEKAAQKKDRLLYYLDRGVVEQMLGNYDTSNYFFEQAYYFSQDYRKNLSADLVGMVANPMLKPYRGEAFEIVLIHFYKALNFLKMGEMNNALVEIRRVNISLNELGDKYEDKKFRYKQDAFAHNLMGIIYEAEGDYNNAFIAYRNAYESYQTIYSREFGLEAPLQLKQDLLRVADVNGFYNDLQRYQDSFKLQKLPIKPEGHGELVFFWLNGLGPVKSEVSLNLSMMQGQGGFFTFADEQEGISVPYQFSANQSSDFSDLKVVRLAMPKYTSRNTHFSRADLLYQSEAVALQKAEDINAIAIANLQDRMLRELAQSVGRLAVKQAAELAVREKNEDLGAVVSLVNAFTEKADTRNWQTLPHDIFYSRIYLPPGQHSLQLKTYTPEGDFITHDMVVEIEAEKTAFEIFHSLAAE
jgi:hypothetical protein